MAEPVADRRWTARAAARRFAEIARDEGPRRLWFKLWGELGLRRLLLVELPAAAPVPGGDARVAFTLEPLRDGELPVRPGASAEAVAERREAGHTGLVARRDGEAVGSLWIARGRLPNAWLGAELPLPAGEPLIYEVYTAPAARGLGVGTAMVGRAIAELRATEGSGRILGLVDPENDEGLALFARLGFARAGMVRSIRPGARRLALGWRASGF